MERRRVALIVVLCLAHALLLGGAWLYSFREMRLDLFGSLEGHTRAVDRLIAERFSSLLRASVSGRIEYGSSDWTRAQSLVESFELPGGGYVCLVGPDGRILSHPDLRSDPSLRAARLEGSPAAGENVELGGSAYVAGEHLGALGTRLLVHTPEDDFVRVNKRAAAGVLAMAGLTLIASVAIVAGGLLFVVRRYESRLEKVNAGLEAEVERRYGQSLTTRHALIMGLARLAETRDTDTGEHLERISTFAVMLAEEARRARLAEIDDDWIECLRLASTLHDIGKVGVPDRVLLKNGPLTAEERSEVERHTVYGAEALESIRARLGEDELVAMSLEIARWHHERWDGGGYPDGLAREEIPLAARIVSIADVYDALTTARVYKEAIPHETVVEMMLEDAGTRFDPGLSEVFARIHEQFWMIRRLADRVSRPAGSGTPGVEAA